MRHELWKKEVEELSLMDHYLKDFCPGDLTDPVYARFFFACCSLLAYRKPNISEKYFRQAGFESISMMDVKGAQCYLLANENDAIIVFRGTEPKQKSDLWADIKTWKRKSETQGSVHAGFKGEVDKLWSGVQTFINSNNEKNLYITGHSLGGAMATIAASRLRDVDSIKACFTYGSPRVGNKVWADHLRFHHQRIQNNNDAVTQTPPMLIGYRHYYPAVYINHYGNIRKLTRWQKLKDMFRGRWAALKKFQFFDGIYDHNMDKYCSKLHKVWEGTVYDHRSHVSAWKVGTKE